MENYVDDKEYTELPFKVMILDKEPVEVTNPYSGESIMLTPTEVGVYDVTMGAYQLGVSSNDNELIDMFYKGKDWFLDNNVEAYMTLID